MFVYVIISLFIVAFAAANCVPNPCQNKGLCIVQPDPAYFFCRCTAEWEGRLCTTPFRYIGCYTDHPARIMAVRLPNSNSNSPLECAARCHGYLYSGIHFGIECFCGDLLKAEKKPDSECNLGCPGDNSKKCGGTYRMSVYSNMGTILYFG
ncbi:hypothetical protein DPMN_050926 [Dreissena polymorpha]|uniref:WSC domain-containing protein n=1 Tax=Dreissena polymorpha TaxID=45954 RepID=A0A9D4HNG2_DREPO|nr:hypothetical protein DPMN_050926 [Dreissena polymorpha]